MGIKVLADPFLCIFAYSLHYIVTESCNVIYAINEKHLTKITEYVSTISISVECKSSVGPTSLTRCYPSYSVPTYDTTDHTTGWAPVPVTSNLTTPGPWSYSSTKTLGGAPLWGHLGVYGGGGYVAPLGNDPPAARSQVNHLRQHTWIDR